VPELPEVETVVRQLAPLVSGRVVRRVDVLDRGKLDARRAAGLVGRCVRGVRRRGKYIVFDLAPADRGDGAGVLLVHLRMSGRLLWNRRGDAPHDRRHIRATVAFDTGSIDFIDPRRFGTFRLAAPEEVAALCGREPLDTDFTAAALGALLAGSRQAIKPWLLRQDRLAGIGNIYACEILHAARIAPTRPAASLSRAEVRSLHAATRATLRAAIDRCGTTFSDFQDACGTAGGYGACLRVYGRAGEKCPACGRPIVRRAFHGRGTFYCPGCQR
jgi:formamidopyrimidine-DNA glycosylase